MQTCELNSQNNSNYTVDYEVVVSDLDIPWGFVFLPDDSILITEKEGDLIHFKNGKKKLISGMPEVTVRGQGGLLDIALHPEFEQNHLIYFTYASSDGEGRGVNTTLMCAELKKDKLINKKVLYKAEPNSRKGQHFGSRIVFDNEKHVYFSVGVF